ncbi:uncharacterized protein [Prorops nasuta]|uniref:uncharacterized protein isoform X2 n=1 Tax=Prorops nasuta TaxID=863751 RepID=UPI0034CF032C
MASGLTNVHQRKLGPAPIASFEDLSDEVENGEGQGGAVDRMPGIVEVSTPVTPGSSLKTPSTPRIDISRASSSSQHEDSNSRESSPERELLAGTDPPAGSKLTLGYKEDAQDLRSSTEELDLQDPIHEQDLRSQTRRRKRREDGTCSQSESGARLLDRERKDSNCSEIILLNISGRTSRLSSVGSQGSGVSGKLSVLSAASATSSRSPSPHKCVLETSFCGSKPMLVDNLAEPSKPETEDLEKILLRREADTTKALIPEDIKIPIVGGNLRPDPLDKPRRRGREERKEIFKKEVEITKRILEKIPVSQKFTEQSPAASKRPDLQQELQKPVSLDFNDRRKKTQDFKEIVQTAPSISSLSGSPKLPRHPKIRELEGSRTPSPSSVSRKSSFASLFKGRIDSVLSPESPNPSAKPRRSITSKIRDTTESLRSRSKSRERVSADPKAAVAAFRRDSKNKGVFSSTLSLFKKRERKKSYDEAVASGTPTHHSTHPSFDSIGHVEFTFDTDRGRQADSVFISLHGDDEEEALPSESVSIPMETPTKLLDEYESEPRSGNIVTTQVSIEHHNAPVQQESVESIVIQDSTIPSDVELSKSTSKDSKIQNHRNNNNNKNTTTSSKGSSTGKKPEVVKPKRKSKEQKQEDSAKLDPFQSEVAKASSVISDLDRNSSGSERDSEIDFVRNRAEKLSDELPDERKGLFYEESFEEDLPYVPTTLPLEKSVAVPILPVKQRLQEVRTIPIERPRSTTPIKPTLLDEFVMQTSSDERRVEKMKISLPREDSFKAKSPRKHVANTFIEFAGKVTEGGTSGGRRSSGKSPSPPPPLPPRSYGLPSSSSSTPSNWINFEEIPEKKKAPKRIQTIPRSADQDDDAGKSGGSAAGSSGAGYSYVQPEECKCECHGHEGSRRTTASRTCNGEKCTLPKSSSIDRASIVSDSSSSNSSLEDPQLVGATANRALLALDSTSKPFGMDLDVSSNRSSIISQDETDDQFNQ